MQDTLMQEIEKEYATWRVGTTSYGAFYRGFRVFLIGASAVVAVGTNLADTPLEFLTRWIPVLALLVSIITAIDTWMKPQVRWRGFMDDRDKLSDLKIRLKACDPSDKGCVDAVRVEFANLRSHHREQMVF